MLIMQGGSDGSDDEAQLLFSALDRLGVPVELAIYDGAGHVLSSWPRPQAVDGTRRVLRYLDQRIGPGTSPN